MSQQLPQFRVKSGTGIGNELFIQFPDISENEKSFFDADEAAAASSAIKTVLGLAEASVKTKLGLVNASIKTFNGLA